MNRKNPLIAAPLRLMAILIVLMVAPIILISDYTVGFLLALLDWIRYDLLPYPEDAIYGPE